MPDKNLKLCCEKRAWEEYNIVGGFVRPITGARLEDLIKAKELHPDALVLVHRNAG